MHGLRQFRGVLAAGLIVFGASAAHADQIITLHSGNGSIGGADSAISMLVGPPNSAFANAFTATDFAAASTGPAATIISRNASWLYTPAFSDPSAQWVSTSSGGATEGSSALYAIDFTITDAFLTAATLDLTYALDNILGGGPNQGLFINGVALPGSTNFNSGNYAVESNFVSADISSLLTLGTNTLYINVNDVGGPAGLLFHATITTTGSNDAPVPAPGALGLLGLGLAALGAIHRRRTV
jgi:MYXO-CTERM domain-containing protein